MGDAEAGVRRAFKLARASVPAILFFDEIDVIDRGSDGGGANSNSVEARVLSTFLNEMDGIRSVAGDGLVVVAATNRPRTRCSTAPARYVNGMFFSAMLKIHFLRLGAPTNSATSRLDTAIHVPAARLAILRVHTHHMPLATDVDLGL